MTRPPAVTPRSRRLGRELKRLRDGAGLTLEQVGKLIGTSGSRIHKIEAGVIRPRAGDVIELLQVYGQPLDSDEATALTQMARALREPGWWQRYDALPSRYATLIAYEDEASLIRTFEPMLVPGLLQTEAYARAVVSTRWETETPETIELRVAARLQRQEILRRADQRPRLHAVIAEAALLIQVGGADVMGEQREHLVALARKPNVVVQVLRFEAGAHMADNGSFVLLSGDDDPTLGYIETLAGNLFLESPSEVRHLERAWAQISTLARSPAESVRLIKEMS